MLKQVWCMFLLLIQTCQTFVACTDSYRVIEVATCGYSLLTAFDRGSSKIGSCSCLIVSDQGEEASFDMWTRL